MPAELDLWTHAQTYVGNMHIDGAYHMGGILQLELLKRNGLEPHHHVLEIGCGALVAGRPLMQFLNPDRYVGIEPNTWLVEAARTHFPDMEEWFLNKRPVFLSRADFDASELDRRFDFVLSHSILSHAAHRQLRLFLEKTARVLSPHGVIVASLRMHDVEGKLMPDSLHEEWQYPGPSYFTIETIRAEAARLGLDAAHEPDYRAFFTKHLPAHFHDWVRVRRLAAGIVPRRPRATFGKPSTDGVEQGGGGAMR